MTEEDLEPTGNEAEGESYTHGAYPQRVPQFSTGTQEDWGWFQHLGTTESYAHEVVTFPDWRSVFEDLSLRADRAPTPATAAIVKASSTAALDAFVDGHNTGYYVNSYTTKLNPTMDDVLRKLLDGVRRLNDEWQKKEAVEKPDENPRGAAAVARRDTYRRTMQVLARFETCFRRASWKGGSEMVFPILFGHLSFMTHRC